MAILFNEINILYLYYFKNETLFIEYRFIIDFTFKSKVV